ncbi:hypothetical protein [Rubritalea marina]|uniref:hypothetical protein n=1 Tax=Rubritalea marina TaxID=361055 RepID=UPI00037F4CC7|nr:hypothetical protein [Rubritalea marina]
MPLIRRMISPFIVAMIVLQSSIVLGQESLEQQLQKQHRKHLDGLRGRFPALRNPYRIVPKGIVVDEFEEEDQEIRFQHVWKRDIPATLFWVGQPLEGDTQRLTSAWDDDWIGSFGGVDDPARRDGFHPSGFEVQMNPFYVALPYNDIMPGGGMFKPEASEIIKWFWARAKAPGVSVCKNRWVAIHLGYKVCYAQWQDVGPFYDDDAGYVFQHSRPLQNRDGATGMSFSPAVRDFLEFKAGQRVSWRFVETEDVPHGPWSGWVLPE